MFHSSLLPALLAVLLVPSVITAIVPQDQPKKGSLPRGAQAFTPEQRRRADQIISGFENDTIKLQYGYTEELGDGRGLTAGRAGFTTATGDLLLVVKRYVARVPGSLLKQYLPGLTKAAAETSSSMDGLAGLGDAWKEAAKDSVFRAVQDQVVDELYFKPAIKWWKSLGARTPLGLLILYDTAIQHGDGDDPDGLRAIIERTKAKAGGTPKTGVGEAKWFDVFLNVRRETLANAHDMETRAAWAAAVQRCDVLRAIANEGNYDLHGPITFKPHRMNFTIE